MRTGQQGCGGWGAEEIAWWGQFNDDGDCDLEGQRET